MPYVDPEKAREYRRRWDQKHRTEYQRRYREAHGGRPQTEASKARQKAKYVALREQLFDLIGPVCVRCGFADKRALQIDHIDGGGTRHRRGIVSTFRYYQAILAAGASGYQTLCANCNCIKRVENGEQAKVHIT